MIKAKDFMSNLNLREISPAAKPELEIISADFNRPGLQFSGFYDYFAWERPQVLGKVEMTYLESMDPGKRAAMYATYFSYKVPCIICCRNMRPPKDFLEAARAHGVGVYLSDKVTTRFSAAMVRYLSKELAPSITQHGVLVDVYGIGVLITGESGVGKSETALELVKRGHQLVADDVVDICRVNDHRLTGECPEMVRHFMEIRGIGIIDIRAMYGVGAVALSKSIDMIIHLERWVDGKEYDRLGLQEEYETILGVKVPRLLTPVRPGRNLAIIVEVAARNFSLRRMGYSAAHELDRRLNEQIARSREEEE
jgi:HPr kinase/phosphorylase